MRHGARIETLREILELFLKEPRPLDQLLQQYLLTRRYVGSKDRHYIKDHIFALFRHWEEVKWQRDLNPRALIIAYLVRILGWNHQDFDQNLETSNYAFAPLTEGEIQSHFISPLDPITRPDEVVANVPTFLWPEFQKSFGKDAMVQANALCQKATLDLRVNTLKVTRVQVLDSFKNLGFDAVATLYSEVGIRLPQRINLESLELFQQGGIEVQDEGSQLLAQFCDVHPEDHVLDLCAGAGGKTLALAAMMNDQGRIIATDIDVKRLKCIHPRLRRAHVNNTEVRPWPLENALGSFDLVLVDSPCSGTGTWRRAPDLRARLTPETYELVLKTQAQLLDQACTFLKPEGRLIYATCSVLSSENEQQIAYFLDRQTGFKCTRQIRLSPFTHQTDGFYGAELIRK